MDVRCWKDDRIGCPAIGRRLRQSEAKTLLLHIVKSMHFRERRELLGLIRKQMNTTSPSQNEYLTQWELHN